MKQFAEEKLYRFDNFQEVVDFAKNENCYVDYGSSRVVYTENGELFFDEYPDEDEASLMPWNDLIDENGKADEIAFADLYEIGEFVGHSYKETK